MADKKFKPTIVSGGQDDIFRRHQADYATQDKILKAMSDGITDPNDLKKLTGLPTIAQVHRTIDKLQMRQEYFQALRDNGLDINSVVSGIRDVAMFSKNDKTKLSALVTILKSIGMDKYDDQQVTGKDWEETLLKYATEANEQNKLEGAIDVDYEVIEPKKPDEMKQIKEAEKMLGKDLFGTS